MHREGETAAAVALRRAALRTLARAVERRPAQGEHVEVEAAGRAAALLGAGRGRAEHQRDEEAGEAAHLDQGRAIRQEGL